MKRIRDEAKQISPGQIDALAHLLNIKNASPDKAQPLIDALLSYTGMHRVLSSLSRLELAVLAAAHRSAEGVTFGELEKLLRTDSSEIETLSARLAGHLLVFILKNRQRLHNKMDKVYIFPEIREMIRPVEDAPLDAYFSEVLAGVRHREASKDDLMPALHDSSGLELARFLFECGGVAAFGEIISRFPSSAIDGTIRELSEKDIVMVRHELGYPPGTFVFLRPRVFPSLIRAFEPPPRMPGMLVCNHYYLLLNMMNAFDVVSSSGLFLTKQREFRKIDKKRLSDSMLRLNDIDGTPIDPEAIAQLALYELNLLRCITMKKDAVVISLKGIEEDLENPQRLLLRCFRLLQNDEPPTGIFPPPFPMPTLSGVTELIETITRFRECSHNHLLTAFLASSLSRLGRERLHLLPEARRKAVAQLRGGIRALCCYGIIEAKDGVMRLSEIGLDLAQRIQKGKKAPTEKQERNIKKIYINPDFTIIIPKHEVPSEAIYHLLAHTDIIKDDVILHTRISKGSIVRAHKRGMPQREFLATLERCARNEIPQNLNFLLNEWSNQTVRVKILDAILLHSSHPSLLDELSFHELKEAVIERLSPHYAIIDRRHLDSVLKFAQKKDAVISLFEGEESAERRQP